MRIASPHVSIPLPSDDRPSCGVVADVLFSTALWTDDRRGFVVDFFLRRAIMTGQPSQTARAVGHSQRPETNGTRVDRCGR